MGNGLNRITIGDNMPETQKRRLPLDFRLLPVIIVYLLAIAVVMFYGWMVGARPAFMVGAFILGLLVGLPAAKWELSAITNSWESILTGPRISFRLVYFKKTGARKRTQYFVAASFLLPLILLFLAFMFYWRKILSQMDFGWSLFLLIRWNAWYWLPYIFGLGFTSTSFPRLVAAASYGTGEAPNLQENADE